MTPTGERVSEAVRERYGDPRGYGALGLGYWNMGALVQALGVLLVDRGHGYDAVVERLTDETFDESDFLGGEAGALLEAAADALAATLGFPSRPTLGLVR